MYRLIEGNYSLDGISYVSYGICNEEVSLEDVSLNRAEVEALVNRCNLAGLSHIHLYDVVQDFLARSPQE